MFRTLPKGLRAPPDLAPALTAKAAAEWLTGAAARSTIYHYSRKGGRPDA
jgi:hypothetical protein